MSFPTTPNLKTASVVENVSPTTSEVTSRESCADSANLQEDVNTKLRLLELRLRDVSSLVCENGSPLLLEDCSGKMFEAILAQLQEKIGHAPKMFVYRSKLYLEELKRSDLHEKTVAVFNAIIVRYNILLSGSIFQPVESFGGSDEMLDDGTVQPDAKFIMLCEPHRACPNMVVEVAVSQSLLALHEKACRYINQSDNILVVVTIKIYRDDENHGVLVAMVYFRRDHEVMTDPDVVISFGEVEMSQRLAEEVRNTVNVPAIAGYCAGNPPPHNLPCTQLNMVPYLVTIDHRLLLASNDHGYIVPARYVDSQDLVIDLFEIQSNISRLL